MSTLKYKKLSLLECFSLRYLDKCHDELELLPQ